MHGAPLPGGRPEDAGDGPLTPYLLRPHDARLRAALDAALAGGTPRLLVLTGESATGKTRALYEALLDRAPERPLLKPSTAADLLSLLRAGRVQEGAVLWLNEAQRFFYGAEGEAAANALHQHLARDGRLVAVATLWTWPYWTQLTAPDRTTHVGAKALLTHPALTLRLTVPPYLDDQDLTAWAELEGLAGDLRLGPALEAGRADGRVIQQLTGGPQLLEAFLSGPEVFFTASEHALIGAALDARRLGHHAPMAPGLLARVADGALTPGSAAEFRAGRYGISRHSAKARARTAHRPPSVPSPPCPRCGPAPVHPRCSSPPTIWSSTCAGSGRACDRNRRSGTPWWSTPTIPGTWPDWDGPRGTGACGGTRPCCGGAPYSRVTPPLPPSWSRT